MSKVSIAVIGLGFMGTRWSRAIAQHHGASLAVVSDIRAEVAAAAGDRYEAKPVTDPLEAVSHPGVDGVVVSTPEHLHVELALAAIDAGKAVAVEKPLAHTVTGAEKIRDAASGAGVPVLAGHILRFEPRYAAIRRAIEADEIGPVQAIRSHRIGLVSDQDILRGRTSAALYYSVHELDLARWYAGEVAQVWATSSSDVLSAHGYDMEDLYSVGLWFANGAHGTATVGWSLPHHTPGHGMAGFMVIGSQGVLSVSQGDTGYQKVLTEGPSDEDVHYSPDVHGIIHGAMAIEADHFVRCVRGETDPVCTASDGTEAVRIALAMERAAQTREVVTP